MKVFVTGVGGQLGHDVVNELVSRGYEAVGSDIQPSYAGIQDHTAVTDDSWIIRTAFLNYPDSVLVTPGQGS